MLFEINFNQHIVPTLKTELIGYFSIDGEMQYRADLSQLKYYIPPSNPNNVNFDLNVNIMSTHYKPTSHFKLDYILRWISDNFHRIERPLAERKEQWLGTDFICTRGTIKRILSSPYRRDDWIICASKYRNTIYLCEFYSDKKEYCHVNATLLEKQISSRGFKFEQFMVADHPSDKPDLSKPLNECEKFYCVFQTNFGNHTLLYSAEIDGISSQEVITDTLIGKTFEFIELKTYPLYNGDLHGKIASQRAVEWWCQNYFVEINRIIYGLKDKTSVVRMIKEYSVLDLPNLSKDFWDVNKCKTFCKIFLDEVKRIVTKDHNECMYKFYWNSSNKYIVHYSEEAPDNETYFFLKSWFVNKAEEYGNAQ